MSFATPTAYPNFDSVDDTGDSIKIEQEWWPEIDLKASREVMRLPGTVPTARLLDALQFAADYINWELRDWQAEQLHAGTALTDKQTRLYLRAVRSHAKAELLEKYRDFDTTGAGDARADEFEDTVDGARRNVRWAISLLLGKPRVTVELL